MVHNSMENRFGGHRARMRNRFLENPELFSDADLLELILTYAIPRKDVAPVASLLLEQFGSLESLVFAPVEDLYKINGLGEATIVLIKAMEALILKIKNEPYQMELLGRGTESRDSQTTNEPKERSLRVFANDEIANSVVFLPKAVSFSSLKQYQDYLETNLPYNSAETRHRRANYFIDRFFPAGHLHTSLYYFLSHITVEASLKSSIFYHVLKSEPAATKVAEELIYSALPSGRIEREQIKEYVTGLFPSISDSSLNNMLRSVLTTYNLLGVGLLREESLRFQLRPGDFEGFLYVFTSEFSEPGIYTYDQLFRSPLHRWLLWDKEWIRKQIFILRDQKVIAKISEIDTVQQFTLDLSQMDALRTYYEPKGHQ